MPYAWFVAGLKIHPHRPNFYYCQIRDLQSLINADGGTLSWSEILGGNFLVKVRASDATLTTIAGAVGVDRIPNHFNLNDTLGDLTTGQRNAIMTRILAMGYTQTEINNALGGTLALWRTKTLRQLLNFICTRRLNQRWNDVTQTIVFDGSEAVPKTPAEVDGEVV